jgi:phosphatidylserine/phosphatidylglycerophosphate/cardiolipin synthase-like enzyme
MSPFSQLSRPTLLKLATALETQRLQPPFSTLNFSQELPSIYRKEVIAELRRLSEAGMSVQHLAYLLKAICGEREQTQVMRDRAELVWTGTSTSQMRQTRVVVQDLFAKASQQVLITSYAIDSPSKAGQLFAPLAKQMETYPELEVKLGLNIPRRWGDTTPTAELLNNFAGNFRSFWCGQRLPEIFYDPRSLSQEFHQRGCLHAKCVVVDQEQVFITSANFTEAAHHRNIEAGVLLSDPELARSLYSQFQGLVDMKHLLPLIN